MRWCLVLGEAPRRWRRRASGKSRYERAMDAGAFLEAVARLRAWAQTVDPPQRVGEWECDYQAWPEIYDAWEAVLAASPGARWKDGSSAALVALISEALYALARDNECQRLAGIAAQRGAETLCALTEAALDGGEPEARWQLAHELGSAPAPEAEPLLLRLADDADEYVRRRAVQSLARLGAPRTEELALREWSSAPDDVPWTRMNALWALHRISSPLLPSLLRAALSAEDPHLRQYAEKLRDGALET
jgi:HEAT repeats